MLVIGLQIRKSAGCTGVFLFYCSLRELVYIKSLAKQQMHDSVIYVFFLLLSYYMFQHCCHTQGAYTKIALKHRAILNLQ